ncbi:MAG: lysylphosphatidylglycerol synthase transmembrane domain-containing protein [Gemmatimonadetes bacterium]|nr:lysylphosphatidylglycerol synthase transmembrane domain-containing protein [Gemmatimonadota bacterium]MDA1103969.1 lysylphosphatidylglycerol synthase transmembrane domain-containing protein [Gemmatimonadota bacterium]
MIRTVARLAVSIVLLLVVSRFVDVGDVFARLAGLHKGWVALGLALSVLQLLGLAWRWVYTARQLGIELPWRKAVAEYYLGVLLNQLLPGGVTGDVSRAWRHARSSAPGGPVVTAVVLERASGQVMMTTMAIVSLLSLPWAPVATRRMLAVVLAALAVLSVRSLSREPQDPHAGGVRQDARKVLLAKDAAAVQWLTAGLAAASYVVVFLVAARAVGVETPMLRLLPLVAPVLMTMLIPVSVAGWGIREAAAAGLWGLVGLTPADGAAISVAYGLLVLVSSLPGVLTLMLPPADRDRRGRPSQA